MTNEEMQRTMEFILQQQANFAAGMELMREQTEKRISNLETAFVGLFNVVTDIGKAQLKLTERVTQLAEAQAQLAADIAEMRESQAEAQAHTDQRVNALIDIIERRRNGESKG